MHIRSLTFLITYDDNGNGNNYKVVYTNAIMCVHNFSLMAFDTGKISRKKNISYHYYQHGQLAQLAYKYNTSDNEK